MAKVEAIGAEKAKGPDWNNYYAQNFNTKRAHDNIQCIWTHGVQTSATQT